MFPERIPPPEEPVERKTVKPFPLSKGSKSKGMI